MKSNEINYSPFINSFSKEASEYIKTFLWLILWGIL